MESSVPSRPKAQRFPALCVPHFRLYAITSGLSMVADKIEHVIGYWVIWELTHSTFWLGYAITAHWLPLKGRLLKPPVSSGNESSGRGQ